MRKVALYSLTIGVTAFIAVSLYVIPFQSIEKLKNGRVVTSVFNDNVSYEIVDTTKGWISLDQISKEAIHAIMLSEDWSYFNHPGIDFLQLRIALVDYLKGKKKLRGASTLTQQLVKNLFLTSERSMLRKAKEAIISLYIEFRIGKAKILETYLNVVEFGPSIYGIQNASDFYFDKGPQEISAREGAFLAMLLPNPKDYDVSFRQKELTPFAFKMIKSILLKLKVAKIINDLQFEEELEKKFDWELDWSDDYPSTVSH